MKKTCRLCCKICQDVMAHYQTVHSFPRKECFQCKLEFGNVKRFKHHMEKKHKSNWCDTCDKYFATDSMKQAHVRSKEHKQLTPSWKRHLTVDYKMNPVTRTIEMELDYSAGSSSQSKHKCDGNRQCQFCAFVKDVQLIKSEPGEDDDTTANPSENVDNVKVKVEADPETAVFVKQEPLQDEQQLLLDDVFGGVGTRPSKRLKPSSDFRDDRRCNICEKIVDSIEGGLPNHMKTSHAYHFYNKKCYVCKTGNQIFETERDFKDHMNGQHPEKWCNACDLAFSAKMKMYMHLKTSEHLARESIAVVDDDVKPDDILDLKPEQSQVGKLTTGDLEFEINRADNQTEVADIDACCSVNGSSIRCEIDFSD